MILRNLFMLLVLSASWASAADRPANRVLFIGIDGTRTDALLAAKAPNIQKLIADGASSKQTNILGSRSDSADTVSGPGWSNLLTGVWPDKHGVLDNDFRTPQYDKYPHYFARIREIYPQARTFSYCTWPPIAEKIVSAATESLAFDGDSSASHYEQADAKCAAKAIETLKDGDPDAMFVYLGQIDGTGHKKGFHPTVRDYMAAIHTVDEQIGEILKALRGRRNFEKENWLVLLGTDHGGRGTNHGGGRDVPEINTVFLVVNGAAAAPGAIEGPTHQVDIVSTALKHLGISPKPEWELDGRAVGLK